MQRRSLGERCIRILPGQYRDAETGLFYNYFRDYDPQTGRYVQSDPIGLAGGINPYGYVENDPLRSIDPLGLANIDHITFGGMGGGGSARTGAAAGGARSLATPRLPSRVQTDPARGRFDQEHVGERAFDKALEAARLNARDLGANAQRMMDPQTGTLIGMRSADGRRGWRVDRDHCNWWDWTEGKKGRGGRYGHEWFPEGQAGPYSRFPGYSTWE